MKRSNVLVIVFLVIAFMFCSLNYINLFSVKDVNQDKEKEIRGFVSQYYESLEKQNYEEALMQFSYDKISFEKDLGLLKRNSPDYKVECPKEVQTYIRNIYYDKNENLFTVETTVQIKYKTNQWIASEIVYVRSTDDQYNIIKILSDDKYCNIRGSKLEFIGVSK